MHLLLETEARCWRKSAKFWRIQETQEPHWRNSGRYFICF